MKQAACTRIPEQAREQSDTTRNTRVAVYDIQALDYHAKIQAAVVQ